MLLRQEVADGVQLLVVSGPVAPCDVPALLDAVHRALTPSPRAVVLDLTEAGVDPGVLPGLGRLAAVPAGWPLPSVMVCLPADAPTADLPGVHLAADRRDALAHVDDRSGRARAASFLTHGPTGPAQARAVVAEHTLRLGLDELSDDVTLVVSEMVTNAVRYAAPPVHLEIEAGDGEVVVAVCDGSPERPTRRLADDQAEGGRGMLLVDLLTDEHGVRAQPPGKTVWVRLHHEG